MISESLSMKKTTVCVCLEDILNTHHINFFSSIEGLANFLRYPYIIEKLNAPSYSLFEFNKRKVTEAIKKLL